MLRAKELPTSRGTATKEQGAAAVIAPDRNEPKKTSSEFELSRWVMTSGILTLY